MLQTAELLIYDKNLADCVPTSVLCSVMNPFAIRCSHTRKYDYTSWSVSHLRSKHRIWLTNTKIDALNFARYLLSLNLGWDFQSIEEMPSETRLKASSLIIDWENKYQCDDEGDDDDDDDWEKSHTREFRLWRKAIQRRYCRVRHEIRQDRINCKDALLALLKRLPFEDLELIGRYQNVK